MRVVPGALSAVLCTLLATAAMGQSSGLDVGSLRILGFTDMKFEAVDPPEETGAGDTSGFRMGQLIFHFLRPLSDHWSVFAETAITPKDGSFGVSFERVIARYRYSDYIKLSMGRYHTPVNWWNENFHHGQWLQTTADRPEMTKFGGKFVPVHFVGVMEEGTASLGSISTSWNLGVGNGRQANIAGAGEASDDDTHRAWLAGIDFRPDALYKLEIGGSVYGDAVQRVDPLDPNHLHDDADEILLTAHVVWHSERPELIAEYATINHDAGDDGGEGDSHAWYAQLGWRLSGAQERFKPYVRYEQLDIDEMDPVYGADALLKHPGVAEEDVLRDLDILTAGLRIDLAALVALKLEYQGRSPEDDDRIHTYVAQLALSF